MKNFLPSLLSRKFLLTLTGGIALFRLGQYSEMVILLLGYVGVEGGADIVQRYKSRNLTASDIENTVSQNIDEPDTSTITTGNTPLFDEEPKDD